MTVETTVTRRRSGMIERILLVGVVGFLAAVLMPLAVPALLPVASAHDTLVSSTPATGESLEQAPETLELTYSDEVLDLSPVVRLTDSAGEEIFRQAPAVSGNTASIDLPQLPADNYQVQWRVVSSDGHPIEGTVDFTVTVGAETTGDEEPAPGTDEGPSTGPDAQDAEPPPPEQADAPQAEQDESGLPVGFILAGAALLAVLALVALRIIRRGRNRAPDAK